MTSTETKFLEDWGKIRDKGRWNYGFRKGLLVGVVSAVLINLMNYIFLGIFNLNFALMGLVLIVAASVISFGTWLWNLNENEYLKLTKDKK